MKNEKHIIDIDELREELGFDMNCENCNRNTRNCQYDTHYSMMDFCGMLDDAIDAIEKKHKQEG